MQKHFGSERFVELFKLIVRLRKPTVCAADGHVLAGALGIALACDLIVASEKATFGTPEINVGAFPFMIMALIYRNVPRKKANELLLLGERWSAQEALAAGIVNRVVPAEDFDAAVADWAEKLAGKSPVIMRLGKEAMRRQLDMPFDDALDYLRAQLTLALSTEDIVEGVTAFFEKREPCLERPLMRPESSAGTPPVSEAERPETEHPASLLRPFVEDLEARRAKIRQGGGEEKIQKQHDREKLTARERIALLIDEGTFTELGIHGRPHFAQRAMDGVEAPADGVITGYGKIDGRLTAVCAYDFTVMAGSMGMTGEIKVTRLRELALTKRIPFIWLLDSAGARVQEAAGAMFAGSGHLFREEVVMSGVIPQVAALMGPCAAGTAYIPGLADFVPMVKGRGSMALAGPHLVKAAVGEDVTQEELGGSRVHTRKSGVGDMEVASDEECIERIKAYLSYMPQNCEEKPPIRAGKRPDRPARGGVARRAAGVQPQAV